MNKRAQIFFPITAMFVMVLVLLFFLLILNEKEEQGYKYGDLPIEVMELSNQHLSNEFLLEQSIEDLYFKKFNLALKITLKSCLDDQKGGYHVVYNKGPAECWNNLEEVDYLKSFNSSLKNFLNKYQRSNEEFFYDINEYSSKIQLMLTSKLEKNKPRFTIEQNKTYHYSYPFFNMSDFSQSSLFNEQNYENFKSEIIACLVQGDSEELCYTTLSQEYFEVSDIEPQTRVLNLDNEVELELIYKLSNKENLRILMIFKSTQE